MTIRLGISVEGPTEERFVKDLLAPHLAGFAIYATPVVVGASRSVSGKKVKGGGISIARVRDELRRLLEGHADGFVTSLYDFYGFGDKLPSETVDASQDRISSVLGRPRNFISYVQLHEFEALLLSDAATVASYFQAPRMRKLVGDAVEKAGSPELVNDGASTAPSKRLGQWTLQHAPILQRFSNDTKVRHGPTLAKQLTLPVIRAACPAFGAWLTRLERLGPKV